MVCGVSKIYFSIGQFLKNHNAFYWSFHNYQEMAKEAVHEFFNTNTRMYALKKPAL